MNQSKWTIAGLIAALLIPAITQAQKPAEPPKAKPLTAPPAVDPGTVIASAGKIEVTAEDFERFLSSLPPQQQSQITSEPAEKRRLADHLLNVKVMVTEAQRRKLDEDPKVKDQLVKLRKQIDAQYEELRGRLLVEALFNGMQNDEAADKKYFEEHKADFDELQARHILISTRGSNDPSNPKPTLSDEQAKKKADDIRARLVKGEDFGALAKKESDDPSSKETGGEYKFGRGTMVQEFEDAAYGLKENEISQPVKTMHGYHVIQLLKRVPTGTYEQAKAQIPVLKVKALIKEATGGQKPTFNEAYLSGSDAAPPAADTADTAPKKKQG